MDSLLFFFFFQAEDGIRDDLVTGVQTCALPIYPHHSQTGNPSWLPSCVFVFPVAQKQITGHTHGGQIDHVTHIRLAKCLSLYCQKTQWLNCMSAPCKP